MKILEVIVDSLKLGRIKQTGKIIDIECKITYTYENGHEEYEFCKSGTKGILYACDVGIQKMLRINNAN